MSWDMNTPQGDTRNLRSIRVTRGIGGNCRGRILLGRYRLEHTISRGGMGTVYLSRDMTTGKRYAIKILRNDLTFEPVIRKRFLREAQMMEGIRHPSLVQSFGTGETADGDMFFVMEYVNGPPLRRLMKKGPMDIERVRLVAAAIAEGLLVAHEAQLIHRDLKPENILIPRDRNAGSLVKIVDFGIARQIDAPRITTTKHVLGTPSYISPEQAMGNAADHRGDIYSFGVILYEMISGKLPFHGDTPEELLERHIKSKPVSLQSIDGMEHLSPVIADLVTTCLAKYPAHRPNSMRDILDVLERA